MVSLKKTIWEPYENFPFHIIISTNFSNILEKYVKFSITKLKFINLKNRKKKKKKKKKKTLGVEILFLKKIKIWGILSNLWLVEIGHYYITHDAFIFTSKPSSHFICWFLFLFKILKTYNLERF